MAVRKSRVGGRKGTIRPAQAAGTRPLGHLSSDWYWEQDAALRFTVVEVNSEALPEQTLARSLIGKTRWETGIETLGGWSEHRAALSRREPFRDLVAWRTFDNGSRRYMLVSGEPMFDAAGRFTGYRGIGRDITPQKRAEELRALEHSVTRVFAELRGASEALKAAIRVICETEHWQCGRYLWVDGAAALLRHGADWSEADPAIERYIEESRSMVYAPGVGLVGKVWQSHEPLWVPDITDDARVVRPRLARASGMRGAFVVPVAAEARTIGVLIFHSGRARERDEALLQTLRVVGTQIGQFLQRMQSEQAMHESEARFRALTHLSSDWYWEQDAEYRFTRLEGRYLTGGDAHLQQVQSGLLGQRRWESGLEIEGGWEPHRALLDARKPFHNAVMWRMRPDGVRRFISVSGEPIVDPQGRFNGYRGVGRDISEQKRAEEMIRLEHHVALTLADAPDARAGLRSVMRAFCEAEGWACARYFELHESAGVLRFRDAWSTADPWAERFVLESQALTYGRGEGLCGKVWETGEAVWTRDSLADPRVKARSLAEQTGIRGAFVLPVVADGKVIGAVSCTSKTVREPDERLREAALVIGRQIGQFMQRKRAEEALRESEVRFRGLTQMSSDFYWETDARHRFTQMVHGPHYASKFGDALIGKAAWDLPYSMPGPEAWATLRASFDAHEPFRDFELGRPWPDGSTRYFTVSGEPRFAADGGFLGYRGVGRETTEIALAREHIASLAYSDALTGLANRTSLGPAFEQAVERARRRSTCLAALFIDLDGFKPVNDAHGHSAGDRILVEVSRRLRASLRASDLIARIGGDEFFVVLEEAQDAATIERVAQKLLGELARPYELSAAEEARISASIGISLYPNDGADAGALMKQADMAMYAAKQAGKNAARFYAAGGTTEAPLRTPSRMNSA